MTGKAPGKSRCYIAGAGYFDKNTPPRASDYIIAADGGYDALVRCGITPHITVGDFDSISAVPDGMELLRHPREKDDTDVMLAVRYALENGFTEFVINGALGGSRLDHTLANIQVLTFISQRGGSAYLLGEHQTVTAVTDGVLRFRAGLTGYVSVFCAGGTARGVYLNGLKYPLSDAVLSCDVPLGVSNEFTGGAAEVIVRNGTLTVVWTGGLDYLDTSCYPEIVNMTGSGNYGTESNGSI